MNLLLAALVLYVYAAANVGAAEEWPLERVEVRLTPTAFTRRW